MRPTDLTPPEIADLLAEAHAQDKGYADYGPSPAERAALADYLGSNEKARNEVWEIWRQDLVDEGAGAYWLDVEFIQPCPRDQDTPFD